MKSSLPALLALICFMSLSTHAQDESAADRQWFLLNIYQLRSPESARVFDESFGPAAVATLGRQGVDPVGVFQPVWLSNNQDQKKEGAELKRYVVVPIDSADSLPSIRAAAAADPEFLAKAADYLQVEKDAPVYSRIESSLLWAFEGMPRLAVPGKPGEGATRLFELRIYESHSEMKGLMKVAMFNEGEIEIFKRVGLDAVFFGEALVAPNLPNLTYMLVYNDEAHRGEVWQKFLSDPKWEEMKNMERYKDTVSKIISQHLRPLKCSGIQ